MVIFKKIITGTLCSLVTLVLPAHAIDESKVFTSSASDYAQSQNTNLSVYHLYAVHGVSVNLQNDECKKVLIKKVPNVEVITDYRLWGPNPGNDFYFCSGTALINKSMK